LQGREEGGGGEGAAEQEEGNPLAALNANTLVENPHYAEEREGYTSR
jgi:hypothetical protein